VIDLFPIELEFVPRQQAQSRYEGLLFDLRERGFDPHMARSLAWGDQQRADALVIWVQAGLHGGEASELANATARWFMRRPTELDQLSPSSTIRVVSNRSGHLLAEAPLRNARRRDVQPS
jgi:hypothetical protein